MQLHVVEQGAAVMGAGAALLALEIGDLQLEMCKQRLDGAPVGKGDDDLGLRLVSFAGYHRHQGSERFDIIPERRYGGFYAGERITRGHLSSRQNTPLAPVVRQSPAA